jgi:hypothetical protein
LTGRTVPLWSIEVLGVEDACDFPRQSLTPPRPLPSDVVVTVSDLAITGLVGVRFLIGDVGNSFIQETPYAGTISSADMFADVTGNAQISVSKSNASSYPTFTSIVASAPATLVSQQKNTSVPLTGWTLTFAKGDLFKFTFNSASTLAWVVLNLPTIRS